MCVIELNSWSGELNYEYCLLISSNSPLSIWQDDNISQTKRLLYVRPDIEEWLINLFGFDGKKWLVDRINYYNPFILYMNSEVANSFKLAWL